MSGGGWCGTDRMPEIRPDLQAAYDEMDATGKAFAFAVCQTWQGDAWEVNTKRENIYCALNGSFDSREAAIAAGSAWLAKLGQL